jgi:sulfite reductase (NADPH) hemoprotein beta-component
MYQYSESEREILKRRALQFGGQVARFKQKAINPDFFQQLRLRNGLYQERLAHMLRVAIPYGCISSSQLHKLGEIATDFDKGFAHFTTRQNIQFNWPELEDVPEILMQLASEDMHAIQTSGSCIRNISCDPLAGVAPDEVADPRPWCELIRQWANLHPEFNWLPRKFKFSVNGAKEDRAVIRMNDIGLQIVEQDDEETYFDVYVGGGMGRTPVIGKLIKEALPGSSLLSYLQSILRVYNQYGRRDHKYRSRIKILLGDLGVDEFKLRVEREWIRSLPNAPRLDKTKFRDLKESFKDRRITLVDVSLPKDIPVNDPAYQQWLKTNTFAHRNTAQRIVSVSLKNPGSAPGDIQAEQMHQLADLAEAYSRSELRVAITQNIYLPHVSKGKLYALWIALEKHSLATPNTGYLTDIIACPGFDYCSLANTTTLDIVNLVNQRFDKLNEIYDLGPIRLNISGCMNSCGHHHVADIGVLGVDKKGEQWYQLTLGGRAGLDTAIGRRLGPAIAKVDLIGAIDKIIETYVQLRKVGETFVDCVERTSIQPFKENVYVNH